MGEVNHGTKTPIARGTVKKHQAKLKQDKKVWVSDHLDTKAPLSSMCLGKTEKERKGNFLHQSIVILTLF
jgi:hypothetical protein